MTTYQFLAMKFDNSCSRYIVLGLSALVVTFVVISYHLIAQKSFKYSRFLRTQFIFSIYYPETSNDTIYAENDDPEPDYGEDIHTWESIIVHDQTTLATSDLSVTTSDNWSTQTTASNNPVSDVKTSTSVVPRNISQSLASVNISKVNSKKYLIYLCDKDEYCYGLGDRQRGLVSAYLLAVLTNRQFGIKMTHPWPLQDFYMPNEVQWDIPEEELKGKSTKILKYFKTQAGELNHINFNQVYPEDVIYVRTNFELWRHLVKNSLYKWNYPWWARGRRNKFFSNAWVKLTKPTPELRSKLNEVLVDIAQSMLNSSYSQTNSSNAAAVNGTLAPSLKPTMSQEEMSQLKGYDVAKLNLVCVHVRIGHSDTLPFEKNVRNKQDSVGGVWDFLKPYIRKGHHVYLATDSSKVRTQAKTLFGDRVHFIDAPVVHVGTVLGNQDAREGFKTALLEQLLLMTSCQVLVVSRSGFSMVASYVRMKLMGWTENYFFENGRVVGWGLWK